MRTRDKRTNSAWAVVAVMCSALAAAPESAQAQEGVPATPAPQGSSMQVTPLKRGWLVAPDVKITQVDDQAATLAGGYVGWVSDGAFLVGAGGVSENFLIAEPQANVLLTLTDWMRIDAGVGYRLIGGTSLLDDRLHGVSGTIAVQFGGGH